MLIPRPESEFVVVEYLEHTRHLASPRAVDVGTGSGCLAIASAHRQPGARFVAIDISEEALEIARRNAAQIGVLDRIDFRLGDQLEPVAGEGPFDAIISNPPYIPSEAIEQLEPGVRDHEPRTALDGGPGGLDMVARLIEESVGLLKPGGHLILEIGSDQERARPVADRSPATAPAGTDGLRPRPAPAGHSRDPNRVACPIHPLRRSLTTAAAWRGRAQRFRQRVHGRPALVLAPGGQLAEDIAELVRQHGFDDGGVERFALMRWSIMVVELVASYGRRSVRNSKASTPKANTSIRSSIGSRRSSSGAMYCSVPVRLPGRRNAGVLGTVSPKSINLTC